MVLSWIIKTLSPQIAESVIYVDNAKDLWEALKERFSKGDNFKISNLLQDIHSIKEGERNVSKYFIDLKILLEELESLVAHVKTPLLQERQERQYPGGISQNDFFKILASTSNKPNWKSQGHGTASHGQGRGRGRNPNYGKQCSHCHKMNHTVYECYSKHGYPPWYKKNDHQTSQDRGGQNEWGYANACKDDFTSTQTQNAQLENSSNSKQIFTPEEMHKLLKMIKGIDNPSHNISQVQRNTWRQP
ncbi:uncharacterized protein LOC124846850, partial [Vigna umbellata]|uniref:uncharacterized protein LOC124846850 n=1 Tax=Vigna umbellata TaxID=87088 RepID=UPI001F5ECFA1